MADERIQLFNRAGAVVGGMVVDAADYAELSQWTWRRQRNLRWVSNAQNNQNVSIRKDNRSGYRGVCFNKDSQRWHGDVKVNGRKVWRRTFSDRESAALATAEARRALLPFATA